MGQHNSLEDPYYQILASLLTDVQSRHSEVFSSKALRLTLEKAAERFAKEGRSFLTKTLPRLGKALDKALSGECQLDYTGFDSIEDGTAIPKFLGELFQLVFGKDGRVLPAPCVKSIQDLRQLLFIFYKLELPYSREQSDDVITSFLQTEVDIEPYDKLFGEIAEHVDCNLSGYLAVKPSYAASVIRRARVLLNKLFSGFDPRDIVPRHGPGAVSTKERLSGKYRFTRLNERLQAMYPFDSYFCASLGHYCDVAKSVETMPFSEPFARVILVPKDSRGPRLISCEPLEFQWIQQGLGEAIVRLVESHPLTRDSVHFTNQQSNQFGALLGSRTGRYATLDLKEASDRVTVGLVRLLFPANVVDALLAARSQGTILPNGTSLKLRKFAPMGSSLCFPIMALTIWSLVTASSMDAKVNLGLKPNDDLLVYGDDVVVNTAQAEHAITILESFGLKINRDKSYTVGLFRESCGVDAFNGENVTPVRVRTLWHHHPSPDVYTSYIDYSNSLYRRGYIRTGELIARWVYSFGLSTPTTEQQLSCPSLDVAPETPTRIKRRWSKDLQKSLFLVTCSVARPISSEIDGWSMLLRFFTEAGRARQSFSRTVSHAGAESVGQGPIEDPLQPFSVRRYTRDRKSVV